MNTMTTEQTFSISGDRRRLETLVSFNADQPLTLSASNASGSVDVHTDASLQTGTLRVAATHPDKSEFEDDDHHLTVKVEDNTVSIHPDWQFASGVSGIARRIRDQLQHGFRPEDWNLSRLKLSPELDFNIEITLPASLAEASQVKIRTASGEVNASDVIARSSVVTASGDVVARNLTGVTAIHTASGDVDVSNIVESLEVNTASGDVTIKDGDVWLAVRSASGDVDINRTALRNSRLTTVSGDISIEAIFNNTGSHYGMETVSGDIDLVATIPGDDFGATLGFGTLSGSSNVQSAWEKRKRREWSAGRGENGPSINVKTVSGDLSARAQLDTSVEARSLEMPRTAETEDATADDFTQDMKEFGREMKQFGKEMKHMRGSIDRPAPPVPPAPPTPSQPETPAEPATPATPPPARGDHGSHIFTAGPSGRDYRRAEQPTSQPTEPVSPPEPFTDVPAQQDGAQEAEPAEAQSEAPAHATAPVTDIRDTRLRVLEALEKGEIDIDDALAQLEADKDHPRS